MGALIMFRLVIVIAFVGGIYFMIQDDQSGFINIIKVFTKWKPFFV